VFRVQVGGRGGVLGERPDESHVDSFVSFFAMSDERHNARSTDRHASGEDV
jgi:hypothetical protein